MKSMTWRIGVLSLFLIVPLLVLGWRDPVAGQAKKDDKKPKTDGSALEKAANALYDGIVTTQLDNGLKVYIKRVPDSAVVTTMVAYKVGSCDEELDQTGLSHYLEHLMFKGTANELETIKVDGKPVTFWVKSLQDKDEPVRKLAAAQLTRVPDRLEKVLTFDGKSAAHWIKALQDKKETVPPEVVKYLTGERDKIMPGDIDKATLKKGGANNAYTSENYTIYHFDFAAEHWQVPLSIEADRMRNLRINERHEFDQEKGAVISELKRDEDQDPYDVPTKTILPILFGEKHPYGHPVIGEEKHVKDATAEIIKSHYDKWYHPNNASIIVVGGIDPDAVLAKIKKDFGPIAKAKLPERKKETEVKRTKPESREIKSKFDMPRLLIGFNGVKIGDPDDYVLDVINSVLSSGKTSRLYKKLIEGEELTTTVSASNNSGRLPGWFSVQAEMVKGKDRAKAEKLILEELKKLADEPVSDKELRRVKQGMLASTIYSREGVHGLADSLARGVTTNDLDYLKGYLKKVQAVTAKDIQATAKKYLDPEKRVVIWSLPEEKKDDAKGGASRGGRSSSNGKQRHAQRPAPAPKGGEIFPMNKVKKEVLDNGLTLLMYENRRLPIFVGDATVRYVKLHEPKEKAGLAALMGRLLDEGTSKHKSEEIAEMIEDVGGSLSLGSGGGSVKVLSPDTKLGLQLLFECMQDPVFPKESFEREQKAQLSEIADAESKPDVRASRLYNATLYGDHPYARPGQGTTDTVKKLTREDCKDFHRKIFVPNNTVVTIVGDFDTKDIIAEVKKLTADWKKTDLQKPKTPDIKFPEKFFEKIETMPDAKQLAFYMGHPGVRREDKDYYKLLVMDYVLGTGPGFTDRLSAKLRDRQGLAYTVSATITGSAGEEKGLFTCYIGTDPENLTKVKEGFMEELEKIRKEKPTEEEVADVKSYLLGNLPFRFTTNEGIAGQILSVETYKLGPTYLEDYKKAISAITPADVLEVAKKHLDPKHMVLVVAGAVDKDGKPLMEKTPPPKDEK